MEQETNNLSSDINDNIARHNATINKIAQAIQASGTPLLKAEIADKTGLSRSYVGKLVTQYTGKYFNYTTIGISVNNEYWNEEDEQLIIVNDDLNVKYPEVLKRLDRIEVAVRKTLHNTGLSKDNNALVGSKNKEREPDLYDKLRTLVAIFKKKMPDMSDEMRKKIKVDMPFINVNNQDEFNSNIIALALVIKVLEEKGSVKIMNRILDENIYSANNDGKVRRRVD